MRSAMIVQYISTKNELGITFDVKDRYIWMFENKIKTREMKLMM